MSLDIPKIYPITDTQITGLTHREQVERLIDGGASFIQLREKHLAAGDFFDAAVDAVAAARSTGVRIIINDRVDIAALVGADGVHLGQTDLPPDKARQILGSKAVIGLSTHTVEQAVAASKLPVDYIAIGPVFDTKTKANPDPTIGLGYLAAVRAAIPDMPLVAIGGITRANVAAVLAAGADSAAIISDLLSPPRSITANLIEMTEITVR